MIQKTEEIMDIPIEFLPLKSYPHITEDNALRIEWAEIFQNGKPDYIMGNPPFVGYSLQTNEQKEDMKSLGVFESKKIDYNAGWYLKAIDFIADTDIKATFISTNSIIQGEQNSLIFKPLFARNLCINFAYTTFQWDSESEVKAHVHCVIISFSCKDFTPKRINTNNEWRTVSKINSYLLEGDNIFIDSRKKPICNVPEMVNGGKPTDDGNLILTEEEKVELLKKEPQAEKFIRPFMMGKDFIQRKPRYCLWLVDANPCELKKCRLILERVEKVRQFRLASKKVATQKKAETPTLFDEIKESTKDYVAIPKVSSENRKYIPIEYLSADVIAGDKLFMIAEADIYIFGVLTSNVHMAWTRAVCGYLGTSYSYSNTVVYNNFPWCNPTPAQRKKIEQTAQAILDARAKYPDCSLADLYDELTMPSELRKAHQANDSAVMSAYGFPKTLSENEIVARLMKLYQELTKK